MTGEVELDVVIHDGDDEAYLQWLVAHPDGFVLNAKRSSTDRVRSIHRANCAHIRILRNSDLGGGFTQRGGIKLCAGSVEDLLGYLGRTRVGPSITVRRCRRCDPIPTDVTIERSPDEVPAGHLGIPSAVSVLVNPYERNALARAICIRRHGSRCKVCDIDLQQSYGALGDGAVQVHFRRPLAALPPSYVLDPINDLVPVCPNCHSMLHRGRETPLGIEDLKRIMYRNRARQYGTRPIGGDDE